MWLYDTANKRNSKTKQPEAWFTWGSSKENYLFSISTYKAVLIVESPPPSYRLLYKAACLGGLAAIFQYFLLNKHKNSFLMCWELLYPLEQLKRQTNKYIEYVCQNKDLKYGKNPWLSYPLIKDLTNLNLTKKKWIDC